MEKSKSIDAIRIGIKMVAKRAGYACEQAKHSEEDCAKLGKLSRLLSNESFGEKFAATKNAKDAVELFSRNGLDLTVVEVNGIAYRIKMAALKLIESDGELNDADMELVAGGVQMFEFDFDIKSDIVSDNLKEQFSSKWFFN